MARYGVTVDLQLTGDFTSLSDTHRTCVYRVVQEALTNCARHAQANHIEIIVTAFSGMLRLTVNDDGIGVGSVRRREGFGLRGIDERVRELNGTMEISRRAAGGTALVVHLPLSRATPEVELARATG
jgi:signal transduction histidine kinase